MSSSQGELLFTAGPESRETNLNCLLFVLKKGIVPRHTFNFPGLEGKMASVCHQKRQENDQLMEVLNQWRKHHH